MKKFYLIAAMALMSLAAQAQQRLTISTYNGTDMERYDGKELQLTVNRYVFNGWNTIALPFSMTAAELDEVFGNSCRLERLVGVDSENGNIVLNFQACKSEGLNANTPYILYYSGETGNRKIAKTAHVSTHAIPVSFTAPNGVTVTMEGARKKTESAGLYGVMARDNSEALFVATDGVKNGFYATRCFIRLSNGNATSLLTNHLDEADATSINAIAHSNEKVDVYSVSGARVASGIRASEVNALQPNVYVVKGRKILVK